MMEPDGTTRIVFLPDPGEAYWENRRALIEQDTAAGIRAILARLTEQLGEAPTFDIPRRTPQPKNWRPWHKHTLPNRRRK